MTVPRILYLSPWYADTPSSASEVRSVQVTRALQQIGHVEVVPIGRGEHERGLVSSETRLRIASGIDVDTQITRSWVRKARWLLDPRIAHPHGLAVDESGSQVVAKLVRDYDLIWFFKLRTANMFSRWAWPRSVVDIDDVPSQFEYSVLASDVSARARLAARLRMWSWRRRERLLGDRFTVLTVCSEADKRYLERLGVAAPTRVIANGFERPTSAPVRQIVSPPRLGFIGVFDHAPNAAGVEWFVQHCWPLIKSEVPEARLRLVGRFTDGSLKPAGRDVDALGYLPDATAEMLTWSAMIVPVLTGAGTRGKIAHAFSQKCPVVSTPLGAYGYQAIDGHDMLVAQSVEGFSKACLRLIRHPQAAAEMAERAWREFLDKWTWDAIRPQVWAAAEECLRSGVGPGPGETKAVFAHQPQTEP